MLPIIRTVGRRVTTRAVNCRARVNKTVLIVQLDVAVSVTRIKVVVRPARVKSVALTARLARATVLGRNLTAGVRARVTYRHTGDKPVTGKLSVTVRAFRPITIISRVRPPARPITLIVVTATHAARWRARLGTGIRVTHRSIKVRLRTGQGTRHMIR
jgi:hypothetical protein